MTTRRPTTALWIAVAAASASATALLILASQGITEDGPALVNRGLARLSFPLFLAAFLASSVHRVVRSKVTKAWLRQRRGIGLAYATVMAAHVVAIVSYFGLVAEPEVGILTILGGGLGFVVIAILAATSNDAAQRRLGGRRWSRLHRAGVYYLWFIYAFTYLGRVSVEPEYWPGLLAVLAALAFRLSAPWLARRHGRAAIA